MPIVDGLKFVSRIRSDPAHKDTPIVVVTTRGGKEDRARALALGANAYLAKPVHATQVVATVEELIRMAELAKHAEGGAPPG
jgi:two-component system chemotaxis response regulator CheY